MGNKGGRRNSSNSNVLTDQEINLLQSRTGLSRQEIQAWHSQFLVDDSNFHFYILELRIKNSFLV